MATPPTFVQEAETVFNDTSSPKTTASYAIQTGDVLVAASVTENDANATSVGGTGPSWTPQQSIFLSNFCEARVWTAAAVSDTSITTTFSRSGSDWFGGNAFTFRGSNGVGTSTKTNNSGAPSLNITTTQDNSAIVVIVGDWNAISGGSRTWRTVNSITPTSGNGFEKTYFTDSSHYTVYMAVYPDAGTAGVKTVGLSAPGGQAYSIIALEVLGAGASDTPLTVTEGTLTFTGQDITLLSSGSEALAVDNATLTFSGQDVGLIAGSSFVIPVTNASLAVEGQDVLFEFVTGWDEGQLTFTGSNVTLIAGLSISLAVDNGSLTFTGQDVTLSPDIDFTLSVDTADLSLAGQEVTFLVSGNTFLDVGMGSLVFTGQDVGLSPSITLPTAGGARRKRYRGVRRLMNIGR